MEWVDLVKHLMHMYAGWIELEGTDNADDVTDDVRFFFVLSCV